MIPSIKHLIFNILLISSLSMSFQSYTQNTGDNHSIKIENIDGKYIDFSKSSLKKLLCESRWTFGYGNITFYLNGTYETGVQDTYEGKWSMDEGGSIIVFPYNEWGEKRLLSFKNCYTLINSSNETEYYSDEYYDAFSDSEDNKKIMEIFLTDLKKEDITGIWVTDEQGEMGELLGFKFTSSSVYFGRPGLELPFGCWEDAEYKHKGTWSYNKASSSIKIIWNSSNSQDIVNIKLMNFYNGAFEGVISPDYFFDEVGDSKRTFWKSECK